MPRFDEIREALGLAACSLWLILHRASCNRGFVLRRQGLSTDTLLSGWIVVASTAWYLTALRAATEPSEPGRPPPVGIIRPWKLAKGPAICQPICFFWGLSYLDGLMAERLHRRAHFFSLSTLRGPFDWPSAMSTSFYQAMMVSVVVSVIVPAISALLVAEYTTAIFNLLGLFVFLYRAAPNNPYIRAQHDYAADRLRIAIPTSHHEGTLYVLPSSAVPIDAVWAPKIANEHAAADAQMMALFQHMRSGRWSASEPLERLRATLVSFHERIDVAPADAARLARWVYADDSGGPLRRGFAAVRAPGVHLIGRDLMFALCHAEYVVFMAQGRLPRGLQAQLGRLRLMSRTGAGSPTDEDVATIGYRPGFDGYREAVEHVYAVSGVDVDASALDFTDTSPPSYSYCLGRSPASIDEYVAGLWDTACQNSEGTFSALYFFTTVWFMELGNVNGFHMMPLRCRDRDGDLSSQQVVWRQVWYEIIIAQLVATSPILFGWFALGYLQ